MAAIAQTAEWKALEAHVAEVQATHLRDLLQDDARTMSMIREHNGIYIDFSRQNATQETLKVRYAIWLIDRYLFSLLCLPTFPQSDGGSHIFLCSSY